MNLHGIDSVYAGADGMQLCHIPELHLSPLRDASVTTQKHEANGGFTLHQLSELQATRSRSNARQIIIPQTKAPDIQETPSNILVTGLYTLLTI